LILYVYTVKFDVIRILFYFILFLNSDITKQDLTKEKEMVGMKTIAEQSRELSGYVH